MTDAPGPDPSVRDDAVAIERFSLARFFGGVFARRTGDEVEEHLSVGFRRTTPPLVPAMAAMPAPWLFGRCLLLTLLIFVPLYVALGLSGNVLLVPGVILVGSFAVPISTLVLFFELNTPRNVSVTRVAYLFVAGAAMSLLLSIMLYRTLPLLGWFGAPAAGVIEETGKLLALAVITRRFDLDRYRYSLNGLLFGAAVGAGFAAFETAGYALMFALQGGGRAMIGILQQRGLLSPFSHIVWTAMTGCLFWRLTVRGAGSLDVLRAASFRRVTVAAMILHAIWNLPIEVPLNLLRLAIGAISWVIVIGLVQSGLREVGMFAQRRDEGA